MPHPAVRPARIRVVGNPGAGKSTFSRALADRLGVPYLELDEICWGPDWTMRDPSEVQDALRRFLASEPARAGWVVDGNWDGLRQGIGDDADVTVWLDYSRAVAMWRLLRRTLRRALTRQELWHGNRECLGNLLRRDPERNILVFAWGNYPRLRQRQLERLRSGARTMRVRTPRQARLLLATARPVSVVSQ